MLPYTHAIFKSTKEVMEILKKLANIPKEKESRGVYGRRRLISLDYDKENRYQPEKKLHLDYRKEKEIWVCVDESLTINHQEKH